jgi:DNA (cytosine-5)-methyltransferase 1
MLVASGVPYCIENVPGAPMKYPVVLCGSMFGLKVRRHRLFERRSRCSRRPQHDVAHLPVWGDGATRKSRARSPSMATTRSSPATRRNGSTAPAQFNEGRMAMGIDWMDWRPLTQAIPPAYSEFIGRAFLAQRQVMAA